MPQHIHACKIYFPCTLSFHAVVADAIVFVILLLLDKPLPAWLYPFVFYFQVIYLTTVIYTVTYMIIMYISCISTPSLCVFMSDFYDFIYHACSLLPILVSSLWILFMLWENMYVGVVFIHECISWMLDMLHIG